MTDGPESSAANGYRDTKGRFLPGNPGGPGSASLRRQRALQLAVRAAVEPSDLEDVVRQLLTDAKSGNHQAARLLFEFAIGRAPDAVEEPVEIQLPDDVDTQTPSGHARAMRAVVDAALRGDITVGGASRVAALLRESADATFLDVLAIQLAELKKQ